MSIGKAPDAKLALIFGDQPRVTKNILPDAASRVFCVRSVLSKHVLKAILYRVSHRI